MKICIFSICMLLFTTLIAQPKTNFPEDWEGVWKGKLEIIGARGLVHSLGMELHISPISAMSKTDTLKKWNWTIIYRVNKDSADSRKYTLIEKDKLLGHYIMDEHNDILLDHYYIGGTLWSLFEVQGTRLMATNRMEGKKMISEISYGPMEPIQTTGGTSEDNPPVMSYSILGIQRAVLKKEK